MKAERLTISIGESEADAEEYITVNLTDDRFKRIKALADYISSFEEFQCSLYDDMAGGVYSTDLDELKIDVSNDKGVLLAYWADVAKRVNAQSKYITITRQDPKAHTPSFFGGAVVTLLVEFAAGVVLNIWMGLHIWDYTHLWGNVLGQVCLPMAIVWLFLMPFALWLEDRATFLYYLYVKAMSRGQVYFDIYDKGRVKERFHSKTIDEDVYIYSLWDAYGEFLFGKPRG